MKAGTITIEIHAPPGERLFVNAEDGLTQEEDALVEDVYHAAEEAVDLFLGSENFYLLITLQEGDDA